MTWEAPAFEEIDMSAEIGGYQGDDGGGNVPPAPQPAVAQAPADPTDG
jgi:coenzyme PQQ precursor peptide PqqA